MNKNDLHTKKNTELLRKHKDKLGLDVPENYFTNSKSKIINKVSSPEKKATQVFYRRPAFRYAAAAVVILVLGLGITLKFLSDRNAEVTTPNAVPMELASMADDDYLIASILVSDQELELFLDQYLMEGVVVKAELEEQEFDNVFMNSLLVKDSLIDSYIDDSFIENIIL